MLSGDERSELHSESCDETLIFDDVASMASPGHRGRGWTTRDESSTGHDSVGGEEG